MKKGPARLVSSTVVHLQRLTALRHVFDSHRVVHLHHLADLDALRFVRHMRRGAAVVITVHDPSPHDRMSERVDRTSPVSSRVLALADCLVTHSEATAAVLVHDHAVPRTTISVIPAEVRPLLVPLRSYAERHGALLAGTSRQNKGVDLFVDAARQLPDIPFVAAGEPRDDAVRRLLAAAAKELDNFVLIDRYLSLEEFHEALASARVSSCRIATSIPRRGSWIVWGYHAPPWWSPNDTCVGESRAGVSDRSSRSRGRPGKRWPSRTTTDAYRSQEEWEQMSQNCASLEERSMEQVTPLLEVYSRAAHSFSRRR